MPSGDVDPHSDQKTVLQETRLEQLLALATVTLSVPTMSSTSMENPTVRWR